VEAAVQGEQRSRLDRPPTRAATPASGHREGPADRAGPAPERPLELLRRFEPVLRFSSGERFFPAPAAPYLAACSLRARQPDGQVKVLVPAGRLRPEEDLGGDRAGEVFLQFVDKPLPGLALKRAVQGVVGGSLTRVGLLGRVIDAVFDLTLPLRGIVPAGTATAAERMAQQLGLHDRPAWHGRVVRAGDWTVLQYLFFYAMNDWRSSYGGANDHEADWEQVLVYLEDSGDGALRPAWVAVAAHDHSGADLRRHWLDPELERAGEHPVVYVAAGSHAGYYRRGEYLARIDVPVLRPLFHVQGWLRRLARLRPPGSPHELRLRVPYVDLADGNGGSIGPGGEREWTPVLLDQDAPWVADYRGLWGLDTAGVTAGERAPAGPKFERDGSVRLSWADPVGFCGLHTVVPAVAQDAAVGDALRRVAAEIGESRAAIRAAALGHAAGADDPAGELQRLERRLERLHRQRSELEDRARRLRQGLPAGGAADLRAHLRHPAEPEPLEGRSRRWVLGLLAALSAPLLLATIAVLLILPLASGTEVALGVLAGLLAAELALRGRIRNLLIILAGLAALALTALLILRFGRQAVAGALLALALLVLYRNLRELLRR
jgi:hypothetical protein